MNEQGDYKIAEMAQLKSLSSPIRQEIVDTVNALGKCSVPEIAAALNRPPDGLYYHVRALLRSGLLRSAGTRQNGRHEEALVRTPSRRVLRLQYDLRDSRKVAEVVRIGRAMLRGAQRDFERGFRSPHVQVRGIQRNLNSSRQKAWLTPEEVREVNQLLARLQTIFNTSRRRKDTRFCSLTFVVAPLD